jgi:hypothetical protein
MKRQALTLAASVLLLLGGAVSAQADSANITDYPCANIVDGEGVFDPITHEVVFRVGLRGYLCADTQTYDPVTGYTTTVDYEIPYVLHVLADRDLATQPALGPRIFDIPGGTSISLLPSDFETDEVQERDFLVYEGTLADENDPTVCVFSDHTGTVTTTVTRPGAADENGNGTTNDDVHKGNGGTNNKDGEKFAANGDVIVSQETVTVSDIGLGLDGDCLPLNLMWDTVEAESCAVQTQVLGSCISPSRSYN